MHVSVSGRAPRAEALQEILALSPLTHEIRAAWVAYDPGARAFQVVVLAETIRFSEVAVLIVLRVSVTGEEWRLAQFPPTVVLDRERLDCDRFGAFSDGEDYHIVLPEKANRWGSDLIRLWSFPAIGRDERSLWAEAFGTYSEDAGQDTTTNP